MTSRAIATMLCAAALASATGRGAAQSGASLPLPHTVGMSGPDVDLIERGIAAYERGDLPAARENFENALAIRAETAVANFDLGVTEIRLGDRGDGARAMRHGYALANEHGMADSPQAQQMRALASAYGVHFRR